MGKTMRMRLTESAERLMNASGAGARELWADNVNACRVWIVPSGDGAAKLVMGGLGNVLALRKPAEPNADWEWDVVGASRDEKYADPEARPEGAAEVREEIEFVPSRTAEVPGSAIRIAGEKPGKAECPKCWADSEGEKCAECGWGLSERYDGRTPEAADCPKCKATLRMPRGLYCDGCGAELPAGVACRRTVGLALNYKAYDKLASWLKEPVDRSWARLRRGRRVTRTWIGGKSVFVMEASNPLEAGTVSDEEDLAEALLEAGAGQVLTDPYELGRAKRMIEREDK